MAIPLSLPYPYLCKVEINNESLKTGNMKIIDLTKESFVEKVADYQSYPDNWEYKGNKPCLVDYIRYIRCSQRISVIFGMFRAFSIFYFYTYTLTS